jgi:hydrogenase-4 component E
MATLLDALLILVFVTDIFLLGTSRIGSVLHMVAIQGVLLGVTPVLAHAHVEVEAVVVGLVTAGLKGVAIPAMLRRSVRDLQIRREVEPFIGFGTSILLGGIGAGLALAFTHSLPLLPGEEHRLVVPAALTTVVTGFILLTTRRKAVNQVVGYVVLENGIFIFGLLLLEAVPLLVEAGVLLDLVAAIFVMGIMLDKIRREFSSIDTHKLSSLKEE